MDKGTTVNKDLSEAIRTSNQTDENMKESISTIVKSDKTQETLVVGDEKDNTKVSQEDNVKVNEESDETNVVEVNGDIDEEKKDDEDDETEDDDESVETNIFLDKFNGRTSQIPDFAVVYSFISLFGLYLNLPPVTISDLETSIDFTKELTSKKVEELGLLEVLHVKLFRRLNKSTKYGSLANCQVERLSKVILKFTQLLDLNLSWDLEQFGYHILTSAQKILILKHLCEIQFDENIRFQNTLKEVWRADGGTSLRLEPYGYEQEGLNVWFHEDKELNFRVYAGEADDGTGDSWKVRAGSVEDLELYISQLKILSEVNPKDIAVEKIKEKKELRRLERDKRRQEREAKRKEEEEKNAKKNKGRKSRRSKAKEAKVESESESDSEEDDGCCRCYENKQSNLVLLCDGCDASYHPLCLRPPVIDIPEGDWFCPHCHQVKLTEKLQGKYNELRKKLLAKERQARRLDFYGIRSANILAESDENIGSSGRRRKKVDYNYTAFDEMINDATTDKKSRKVNGHETSTQENNLKRSKRDGGSRQHRRYKDSDGNLSSGSDFALSESDSDNRRNNIKDFLVDDDYDEIEERHRNKYLRRSKRNRGGDVRGFRRKYRNGDESNDDAGNSSDGSSDSGPRRSKRQRRVSRKCYDEHDSEEENGNGKEKPLADDKALKDEWKKGEDEGVEEFEAVELPSDDDDDDDESDSLQTPSRKQKVQKQQNKKRKRQKKIMDSDDEDDEDDIPLDDDDESIDEEEVPLDDDESNDDEIPLNDDESNEEEDLEEEKDEEIDEYDESPKGENIDQEPETVKQTYKAVTDTKDLKLKIITNSETPKVITSNDSLVNDNNLSSASTQMSKIPSIAPPVTSLAAPLPPLVKTSSYVNSQPGSMQDNNLISTTDRAGNIAYPSAIRKPPPPYNPPAISSNRLPFNTLPTHVKSSLNPISAAVQKMMPPSQQPTSSSQQPKMISVAEEPKMISLSNHVRGNSSFTTNIPRHVDPSPKVDRVNPKDLVRSPPWDHEFRNEPQPMSPTFQQRPQNPRYPQTHGVYNQPYNSPLHQLPDAHYQDHSADPTRSAPMRPTPMYSHHASYVPSHHAPYQHQQAWPGMMRQNAHYYNQLSPQSVPTKTFYGNPHQTPPQHQTHHGYTHTPYPQTRGDLPIEEPKKITTLGEEKINQERIKKQKNAHARQEKEMLKMQMMFEREQRKRGRSSPVVQYQEANNAPKGIGYFKNMVISGDNSSANNSKNASSYPSYSPGRM